MNISLITGSSGLIGSEAVKFFSNKFDKVIGIDNDMRSYFFGSNASTEITNIELLKKVDNYIHQNIMPHFLQLITPTVMGNQAKEY